MYEVFCLNGEMLVNEMDIAVYEIVSCCEDITLSKKWKRLVHNTKDCFYIMLGLDGSTVFTIDGTEYEIEKNDVFFIPENTEYKGRCNIVPARNMEIIFKGKNICGFDKPIKLSPKKWEKYEELFFSAYEKYFLGEIGYKTHLKSLVYSVLNKVTKELVEEKGEERSYRKIKNSILYIRENYASYDMSIEKAAAKSHMSEVHFRRLFRDVFGVSPITYITDIRIKKAKELLKHTEYRIGDIALKVGMYDEIYFSKFFKKHTGMTPNEYRKNSAEE